MECTVTLEADVLAAFPAEVQIPAQLVADAVAASSAAAPKILVVLDDDPTGTQSVADLAVLTRWDVEDFTWAFTHIRENQTKPAVYVLTNTRSLDPAEAAARNEEVVRNALAAAAGNGVGPRLRLGFVSRSDSTLRGHYPLEPDVIAATVAAETGEATDGVVIVPAFPDAGRVTIGGVHYMRGTGENAGSLTPVAETEFAKDASFGFANSEMAKYVEEKSQGRFPASDVIVLDLNIIRAGASAQDPTISAKAIADALEPATNSTPIVADIVTENDFRALALGLEEAERRGKKLLYRVGPPFVRGRIGQEIRTALTSEEAYAGNTPSTAGGLIVVGSHVGVTTRQLNHLTSQHSSARIIEIDVEKLLRNEGEADAYIGTVVSDVVASPPPGRRDRPHQPPAHQNRRRRSEPEDRPHRLRRRRRRGEPHAEDFPAAVRHRQGRHHFLRRRRPRPGDPPRDRPRTHAAGHRLALGAGGRPRQGHPVHRLRRQRGRRPIPDPRHPQTQRHFLTAKIHWRTP
jgi:uncharacterized protein YgbK (DUF1537 family)